MKTDLQITLNNLKIVLEKLPKLAEQLPEIKAEFDMEFFGCYFNSTKSNTVCNTQGCLLGNMARVLPITVECYRANGQFCYTKFSSFYFPYICCEGKDVIWGFLFSDIWSHYQPSFEQAIERLKYFIDCEGGIYGWEFQKESFIKE